MSTHIVRPIAIKTCQNPLPKANVIATTRRTVGIDQTTLINHIITLSIQPPKYPDIAPSVMPINQEMKSEISPTAIDTLVPTIN